MIAKCPFCEFTTPKSLGLWKTHYEHRRHLIDKHPQGFLKLQDAENAIRKSISVLYPQFGRGADIRF